MKTLEETKKGLEICYHSVVCDECPYRYKPWTEGGRCVDGLQSDALAHIEQLESQIPRWIPVEERLPERHGQQCVGLYSIGEYKGYLTPYIFTWNAYGNNGYVDGPHFNGEGLDGLKVHYWMPLPEPPKGGS